MRQYPRKTNPGVRNGDVQKKHRTAASRHYKNYYQETPFIDRLRPGQGYRHLLRKQDLTRFVGLLPDWEELSQGLDAIILAPGDEDTMGYYDLGIVAVCAWPRELAFETDDGWIEEHQHILTRLQVATEKCSDDAHLVHWTEPAAKAFQLLHVLLHELGHHHDRMTTKSQSSCARGEPYAEHYANHQAPKVWDMYFRHFPM